MQLTAEEEVDEEVFRQAYIPRSLDEVAHFERDHSRLQAGQRDGIYFQTITGRNLDGSLAPRDAAPHVLQHAARKAAEAARALGPAGDVFASTHAAEAAEAASEESCARLVGVAPACKPIEERREEAEASSEEGSDSDSDASSESGSESDGEGGRRRVYVERVPVDKDAVRADRRANKAAVKEARKEKRKTKIPKKVKKKGEKKGKFNKK